MSQDPVRLCDSPDASPGVRADLAIARGGSGVPYDEARGLARLQAAILLSGGPGSTGSHGGAGGGSPPPPPTPAPAPVAGVAAIPWGAAAVGASAAGALLLVWTLAVPPAPPAAPPLPIAPVAAATAKVAAARSSAAAPAPAPSVVATATGTGTAEARPPVAASASSPPRGDAQGATVIAPDAGIAPTLVEEAQHLARVRGLAARDPAGALALIDEGNERFAGGALWPERELFALEALQRLGRRADAAARGERLLARYPDGPTAERIRALIGAAEPR